MAHLLLLGAWNETDCLAALLQGTDHSVTMVRNADDLPSTSNGFGLIVAHASTEPDITEFSTVARRLALPWVVRSVSAEPALVTNAYRAGALAVLPSDAPPDLVRSTVERFLATVKPVAARTLPPDRQQRRYLPGDRISLSQDNVLEVLEGVVALTVLHSDGTEVLLGLYGPGQVLTGHPEDACCIQLYAHTGTLVQIQPWQEVIKRPDFNQRLRDRLRQMEAWAAMQARPNLETRVLGTLSLLAEQFGRRTSRGTLLEVRITHIQLSSAVGATRTTITRLLGQLRRQGVLAVVPAEGGGRFCLRDWDGNRH
jgi:CRP-like cAMP-binding protein